MKYLKNYYHIKIKEDVPHVDIKISLREEKSNNTSCTWEEKNM